MNTMHLKYAVEVERAGSISKAAAALYMGQPRLSKAIRELEQRYEIEIFTRTPQGVTVTEKGREFLSHAKSILAQLDEMETLRNPEKISGSFLYISAVDAPYVTGALARFIKSFPEAQGCDIRLATTITESVIDEVETHASNLGIIRYPAFQEYTIINLLKSKRISHTQICTYAPVLLMHKDNPLNKNAVIEADMLDSCLELYMNNTTAFPLAQNAAANRIMLDKQSNLYELLAELPLAYAWSAPLPENALGLLGLVQRGCAGHSLSYHDVLISPADTVLNASARAFSSCLNTYLGEVYIQKT